MRPRPRAARAVRHPAARASPATSGPEVTGGDPTIDDKEWKKLGRRSPTRRRAGRASSCNDLVKLGELLPGARLQRGRERRDGLAARAERARPGRLALQVPRLRRDGRQHDPGQRDGRDRRDRRRRADLGFRTIWRPRATSTTSTSTSPTPRPSALGFGPGGAVGALEETTLVVKLIDWDTPVLPFTGFGGAQGGFFGGPPDMQVAATICDVLDKFHASPKVRLSAFETAIVESGVHNLKVYYDHDSLGVFQQRANWGTWSSGMDPALRGAAYVRAAVRVNSDGTECREARPDVQNSGFPLPLRPGAVAGLRADADSSAGRDARLPWSSWRSRWPAAGARRRAGGHADALAGPERLRAREDVGTDVKVPIVAPDALPPARGGAGAGRRRRRRRRPGGRRQREPAQLDTRQGRDAGGADLDALGRRRRGGTGRAACQLVPADLCGRGGTTVPARITLSGVKHVRQAALLRRRGGPDRRRRQPFDGQPPVAYVRAPC